jgi:hypothetical protein
MRRISPLGWVAILSAALLALIFLMALLGVKDPLHGMPSAQQITCRLIGRSSEGC